MSDSQQYHLKSGIFFWLKIDYFQFWVLRKSDLQIYAPETIKEIVRF